MTSFRSTRTQVLAAPLALALALALVLPPATQAASSGSGPAAPSVSTGKVGHVTGSSAVLEGSVNPHTLTTTYYFEYGPTTTYTQKTAPGTLEGTSSAIDTVKVNRTATGFLPGDHYRLVATNADGESKGRDHLYTVKSKKGKSEFVLPKTFTPVPLGGAFVLSGTLTGSNNGSRELVLQATPYPYTAPYTDVGAAMLTSPSGAFSFRVASMSLSTRFRVATVAAPLVLSRVVPESVTVRVVLKVRSVGHGSGLVRLYGTVTPAEVGAHVFLQLEKPAKAKLEKPGKPEKVGKSEKKEASERAPTFATKFNTLAKRATRSISRFSLVVNVRDAGHYRAFVEVRPGPLASGTSPSVLVHAPAKKGKSKRKKG